MAGPLLLHLFFMRDQPGILYYVWGFKAVKKIFLLHQESQVVGKGLVVGGL